MSFLLCLLQIILLLLLLSINRYLGISSGSVLVCLDNKAVRSIQCYFDIAIISTAPPSGRWLVFYS